MKSSQNRVKVLPSPVHVKYETGLPDLVMAAYTKMDEFYNMKTEKKIRVVLYDDNDTLRDSVGMMINSTAELELAGSFPDCTSILNDMEAIQPDVVIMDIDMPAINGIEAVKMLRKSFLEVQVLMQTVFDDDEKVFAAIKAGAVGYILKSDSPHGLMNAIREAYSGGAPMSPSIARKVMKYFHTLPGTDKQEDYNLSAREKEVLQYLVQGLPIKIIASNMSITYDTVRAHIKKIYQKLHVASMTEAVAKAINQKLFLFW